MIERQCVQENDFTIKTLGYLFYEKQHFMKCLLKTVFPNEEITPEVVENSKIVFFTKIAENLIRELANRYSFKQQAIFEQSLCQVLGFPNGTILPKNNNGKLMLISKWQAAQKAELANKYKIPLNTLNLTQASFNSEPDITIDCWIKNERYLILIEVKLLSDEGNTQLERQAIIGKIFAAFFQLKYVNVFISPNWCKPPSLKDALWVKFTDVAEWFNHKPLIKQAILERTFYYEGNYKTLINGNISCPSEIQRIYDKEDEFLLNRTFDSSIPLTVATLNDNLPDDWNIKYLGKQYFLNIDHLWKIAGLTNKIKEVGIGISGKSYRLNGKPNWMVILENGDTYTNKSGFSKFDRYKGKNLVFYKWNEIVSVFGMNGI